MITRTDLGRSHAQLLAERDRDNEQAILDDERRLLRQLMAERNDRGYLRHELAPPIEQLRRERAA